MDSGEFNEMMNTYESRGEARQATFDEAAHKAAADVASLVVRKQRDYGPKNILNSVVQPELAIAVRLNDKLARLANLVQSGATPENETLVDTADDIIGYGIVLKMVLEGTFERPLADAKVRLNPRPEPNTTAKV